MEKWLIYNHQISSAIDDLDLSWFIITYSDMFSVESDSYVNSYYARAGDSFKGASTSDCLRFSHGLSIPSNQLPISHQVTAMADPQPSGALRSWIPRKLVRNLVRNLVPGRRILGLSGGSIADVFNLHPPRILQESSAEASREGEFVVLSHGGFCSHGATPKSLDGFCGRFLSRNDWMMTGSTPINTHKLENHIYKVYGHPQFHGPVFSCFFSPALE